MKKLIIVMTLLGAGISYAPAQKVITKNLAIEGQNVEMKFDFADTVIVEAWNKSTITLEVTVNIDDNQYNDYYELETSTSGEQAKLVEHIDFKEIKKLTGEEHLQNFNMEINYKLKVPADLEFSLKTISGKIELVGETGKLAVNSVSGYIDYSIPPKHKASIDLVTVTGNVYSNVNFDRKPSGKISCVGTKQKLSLNGGNIPVELKTVSGDIFIRKLE